MAKVELSKGSVSLRRMIVHTGSARYPCNLQSRVRTEMQIENCLIWGPTVPTGHCIVRNTLFIQLDSNKVFRAGGRAELHHCTVVGTVCFENEGNLITDSIAKEITATRRGTTIKHCVAFPEGFTDLAQPGEGCLVQNPLFAAPRAFDYRLLPGSPCIGKASDGGDIGVRWTPEMLELCKIALELRARGVIKF